VQAVLGKPYIESKPVEIRLIDDKRGTYTRNTIQLRVVEPLVQCYTYPYTQSHTF
jgi:hypothetical protein